MTLNNQKSHIIAEYAVMWFLMDEAASIARCSHEFSPQTAIILDAARAALETEIPEKVMHRINNSTLMRTLHDSIQDAGVSPFTIWQFLID